MGIKNTKAFWPPSFPSEEKTITLGDGLTEELTFEGHTWIKFNGRTIALMASHVGSDPNTDAVLYANNRIGYPGKTFASIEVNIGESFTLYDVKFVLKESQKNVGSDIRFKYDVMKATKSAPVDLQLNTTSQFNFETVFRYYHDGTVYYVTLGSIGERRVDFFIWNSSFEAVESLSFRSSMWCKVGDFVFSLQNSTNDTASLFIKKQTTRNASLGAITLAFDEVISIKDKERTVTMQVVKMGLLHPGYFDLWCTLDTPEHDQVTGYLNDMLDDKKPHFFAYKVRCKSVELPTDSAPQYKLTVKFVNSPDVNLNEEFTLMKDTSVTIKGANLKIRFDRSLHRRAPTGVVGFVHLTTTLNAMQKENLYKLSTEGATTFNIGVFSCKVISTKYNQCVTMIVSKETEREGRERDPE